MYRRRKRYRAGRRREAARAGIRRILVWISVVCILVACAATALKVRKATQTVEARSALMQASAMEEKTELMRADDRSGSDGQRPEPAEPEPGEKACEGEWEEGAVIIIDPGHGGMDGGCVFGDIVEKDINRMIAAQVVVRLEKMGYEAQLAREEDEYIDKAERVENANRQKALLYVSIHQNSCEDHSVQGIETWYDGEDETRDNRRLAQLIQQETVRETGAVSRELVSDPDLCVTGKSDMPSCLIETGFLSNREERAKLATAEYREQLADGIVRGIDRYLHP